MSLIIGINLSDRIYLAGDTRITQRDYQDRNTIYIDNVVKVTPLYGKNVFDAGLPVCTNNNLISMAIAGDVSLANYVYLEIRKSIYEGKLSNDIRILFEQLNHEYLNLIVSEWLLKGGKYGDSCCLIFGGMTSNRNKNVSVIKLKEMVDQYKETHKVNDDKRKEWDKMIKGDETWQIINKKMQEQAGKTVIESLEESSVPYIPSYIENAIKQNGGILADFPDSLVFRLDLKILESGLLFDKKTAEWGQYLARGSEKIDEGDLPDDLLSFLELMPGKEKGMEHLTESVVINKTILDIAERRGIKTIGGTVVINCIKKNQSQVLTNGKFENGKMFINVKGFVIPAVGFTEYLKLMKKGMSAEL